MTATLAEFDGYKLRAPGPQDRARLEEWIAADPVHAGLMTPEFFMGRNEDGSADERPTCLVMEDGQGEVFYIRISRAARVNIQFGEAADEEARTRTREALLKGMAYLEATLAKAGVEEWVFETESPGLKALARRRMGFTEGRNLLVRPIDPPEAPEEQEKALPGEQEIPQEAS